jgi:hypothetical protein
MCSRSTTCSLRIRALMNGTCEAETYRVGSRSPQGKPLGLSRCVTLVEHMFVKLHQRPGRRRGTRMTSGVSIDDARPHDVARVPQTIGTHRTGQDVKDSQKLWCGA